MIRIDITLVTILNAPSVINTRNTSLVERNSEEQKKVWGKHIQINENHRKNNPDRGTFQRKDILFGSD